eukprot:CAMPEP_0174251798 /NCGR_PEP_ID=MMETSP0439-20130205/1506_1 /TAXON_ID=0 /ORGANISM="Stereomyxa ramosa, Strain Chinc5" /LENGTH=791 /DNA_ID=CAMNT_0015332213 /DNA_START=27 /DNA_END=2402 /DNA_ORIENTATION=+
MRSCLLSVFYVLVFSVCVFSGESLRKLVVPVFVDGEPSGETSVASIKINEQGIPFISGDSETQVLYAQGQWAAENRLWQMEWNRRLVNGSLAEIFGLEYVVYDGIFRKLGYNNAVIDNLNYLSDDVVNNLKAYVKGVNDYLDTNPELPPEFGVYGIPKPVHFAPSDPLLQVKLLSLEMGLPQIIKELERAALLEIITPERLKELLPYNKESPIIIPQWPPSKHPKEVDQVSPTAVAWKQFIESSGLKVADKLRELAAQLKTISPARGYASNNWVVHGNKTASGKPLLCNDPHLIFTAPMIWYLIGLECPTYKAMGTALPMVPGVIIGRSDMVGWGFTNMDADVGDFYVMNSSSDGSKYWHDNQWKPYVVRKEMIKVKGAKEPIVQEIHETVYGPVMIGNPTGLEKELVMSLKWNDLDPKDRSGDALIGFGKARNITEFMQYLSFVDTLNMNAVMADQNGDIAYHSIGSLPDRRPGDDGALPKPGNGSMDWLGMVPFNELPMTVNPKDGWIASANNIIVPPDSSYPHVIAPLDNYDPGFRATRIVELLKQTDKHTIQTMKDIQGSVVDTMFPRFMPALKALKSSNATVQKWIDKLRSWDGDEQKESELATVFQGWFECLGTVTDIELGSELHNSIFTINTFNSGKGDKSCLFHLESCEAFASKCFEKVIGQFPDGIPTWGTVHHAKFSHDGPSNSTWDSKWTVKVPLGGSSGTPFAADNLLGRIVYTKSPSNAVAGPSYREIIDFSDIDNNSLFVIPMGQSGDPTNTHYRDLLPLWQNVSYLPMKFQFASVL